MNKEKKIISFIVVYIVLLCGLGIVRHYCPENVQFIINVLLKIMVILIILFFVITAFTIEYVIRKDNREFNEMFQKKQYDRLTDLINKKITKYFFGRTIINSKYNLLVLLFAEGNNREAFELLNNTYWRSYITKIYFYQILYLLYIKDQESAKKILPKLMHCKGQEKNLHFIKALFDYVDNNNESEILSQSLYPIVENICKNYEK